MRLSLPILTANQENEVGVVIEHTPDPKNDLCVYSVLVFENEEEADNVKATSEESWFSPDIFHFYQGAKISYTCGDSTSFDFGNGELLEEVTVVCTEDRTLNASFPVLGGLVKLPPCVCK